MRDMLSVQISRRYDAPMTSVFDAWLDPAMIGRFMFGARLREESVVSLDNDPRIGGQFHYKVARNGAVLDHTGVYRELDRPHRLAFSWGVNEEQGDRSVVTLTLAPDGDGSMLTLTHAMHKDWADYAERTRQGWLKIADDLQAALK